jgi:hypothetical protein
MTADQRVTLAREYLAGARQRDINYLPPSRLMAELAETRRQLGQVLAAVAGQAPPATGAQLVTVLDALEVAADDKRDRAATCPDCEAHPAELCGTCEYRLAAADDYDALAETLRGQRRHE